MVKNREQDGALEHLKVASTHVAPIAHENLAILYIHAPGLDALEPIRAPWIFELIPPSVNVGLPVYLPDDFVRERADRLLDFQGRWVLRTLVLRKNEGGCMVAAQVVPLLPGRRWFVLIITVAVVVI